MRVIHVLRKPLSEGTVAANVLKHGCGGLNIDASRIAGEPWTWGTQTDIRGGGYGSKRPGDGDVFATNVQSDPKGRWPANVILQHLDGCQCDGIKKVKNQGGVPRTSVIKPRTVPVGPSKKRTGFTHYFDPETGKETVANWICAEGCPVARLDGQSGTTTSTGGNHSGHNAFGQDSGWNPHQNRPTTIHRVGDKGGASRFFKQIGGAE